MRKGYLSHRRPATAQVVLCISSLSRAFIVCRHVIETLRKHQAKKMPVAQIGDYVCTFEKYKLENHKVLFSYTGSFQENLLLISKKKK